MDLRNIVSFVDVATRKKTPMRIPEQIKAFQNLLSAYNGTGLMKLNYKKIQAVMRRLRSRTDVSISVIDKPVCRLVASPAFTHRRALSAVPQP